MKKNTTKKKKFLPIIAIGGALFFLFLVSLGMHIASSILYQQNFLSKGDIVDAFITGDSTKIAEVSEKYNLWYQRIDKKAVVSMSTDGLPVYKIVSIAFPRPGDILVEKPQDLLAQIQPYFGIAKGGVYIMIPLADTTANSGYLVYKPITL